MRFAVFARPGIGRPLLHSLADVGLEPAVVVTADPRHVKPDSKAHERMRSAAMRLAETLPRGGRKVRDALVPQGAFDTYRLCRDLGWTVWPEANVCAPGFDERLGALALDVIVVFGFSLLAPSVLAAASEAAVGFHPSLLPRRRGAAPQFWSVLTPGDDTGFTLFRLDAGMDTGQVIEQTSVPLHELDDAHTALSRMAVLGARSMTRLLLRRHAGRPIPPGAVVHREQADARPSLAACRIDDGLARREVIAAVAAGRHLGGAPLGDTGTRVLEAFDGPALAAGTLARGRSLVRHRTADGDELCLVVAAGSD